MEQLWGVDEVVESLLSGEAKVIGTNNPEVAAILQQMIDNLGLDATVKLREGSLPPDLALTYPYQN